jgi:ATP-dependent Lon protease
LWASELSALYELRASNNEAERLSVRKRYNADLERLRAVLNITTVDIQDKTLQSIDESTYPIRLYHFEKAIHALESTQDTQRREMEEALILTGPTAGASLGLYATDNGTGGIITVECSTRPLIPGETQVSVTGNSTSFVVGQSVIPDESVLQSAQNATEAVRSWLWVSCKTDLSRLHVHFQIRSLLEGAPGQGVSGPSAGLAMVLALLSELSGTPISPSIVATGTIGVKLDIGPVGGLGGYGTQTGKIVGILKSRRIAITDLVLPVANYDAAEDEMKILREEDVQPRPVRNATECLEEVFGLSEPDLIRRIKERFETAELTERN